MTNPNRGLKPTSPGIIFEQNTNVYQMIIHTTTAMQTAWKLYENLGFKRSADLDFLQEDLPVYGFRLILE